MTYLELLVNGPWEEERFLTCPPGYEIVPDFSNRKFTCGPYETDC